MFDDKITPKLHLVLHYPQLIREMGPVAPMSMMKFESAHKSLKTIGKKAGNFKNITKTISYRKEAEFIYNGFTYQNELKFGKMSTIDLTMFSHSDKEAINVFVEENEEIVEVDWFKMNGLKYRRGLAMIINGFVYSIENILIINEKCYFLCYRFDSVVFHSFTHSIVVERGAKIEVSVFEFEQLTQKQPYEIKDVNGKYHIFATTLNVTNILKH